jgi:hypothetical protein
MRLYIKIEETGLPQGCVTKGILRAAEIVPGTGLLSLSQATSLELRYKRGIKISSSLWRANHV